MGATAQALAAFAGWYVLLTLLLVTVRTPPLLGGKPVNSFATDGSDLGGLAQRVTRARDNTYETMPLLVALALAAFMVGRTADVTDPLAMWVVYARIAQSLVHIASTATPAVLVRAGLFTVQVLIYLSWVYSLLFTAPPAA